MHRLFLLGLNHTTAPLEVRERLAFNAGQRELAVQAFRTRFPKSEAVLLSTCNRVELYIGRESHANPSVKEMVEFLASFHNVPADAFEPHLYRKVDREVVEHLFHVSSSLDSMVLGETQILGQVRDAYDAARRLEAAGPLLHSLFQRALSVGKQVMHDTSITEGRVSVASVAVDCAKNIFDHFNDKTVLCIGAGKMAALVLQNLVGLKPRRLLVCNRDPIKAKALASKFSGEAVPFDRLSDHLVAADIVVSSTGATLPIITRTQFEALRRQRRYRRIFLIDIAVPRDIEPSVGEVENTYLYNLDDLQQVVADNRTQRTGALDAALDIVRRQVDEFVVWHRQRDIGPLISALYEHGNAIVRDEVDRMSNKFPNAGEAEKKHLEELGRRILNKLLHGPIDTLRAASGGASHLAPVPYAHAVEKLFGLSPLPEKKSEPADQPPAPQDGADPDGTSK